MSAETAREDKYALELEKAITAAENPNNHDLEEAEEELAAVSADVAEKTQQIEELQKDIASQTEAMAKLQQKHDELAEQVDAEYYYSIIDSLSEGVKLVEAQIDNQN